MVASRAAKASQFFDQSITDIAITFFLLPSQVGLLATLSLLTRWT